MENGQALLESNIFRYWGKATREGEYHLLPFHCLDVAAVASAWWEKSPTIRRIISRNTNLTEEVELAWVLFFIALHDYGKFDVRFQRKAELVWRKLYPGSGGYRQLPSLANCMGYFHGKGGLYWAKRDHEVLLGLPSQPSMDRLSFLDFPGRETSDQWAAWKPWLEAVTGHHGHVVKAENISSLPIPAGCDCRLQEMDQQTRKEWVDELARLFLLPVGLSLNDMPPTCSSLMAGFCSVSDWLASRSDAENFVYHSMSEDLRSYFTTRRENDAHRILEMAGVVGKPHSYTGVKSVLNKDDAPRSVQTLVDDLPLKPGLTIMEASTGCGKTEAALSYAWRLVSAGLADSIVFALPTQATANAMLDRLEKFAPLLFGDHSNVLLAHGKSRFNETFSKLKSRAIDTNHEADGWGQCSAWLAESRKRVFLGQIGVCTVDQVLISVLPVRHRFVRSFGIGRSVLIVDEVHAYDTYMYGLLEEVVRQQQETGGSAILLSATLPEAQRDQLLRAWGGASDVTDGGAQPYPLVTWTSGGKSMVAFSLGEDQQPVSVCVEPVITAAMLPDDSLMARIIAAADAGAQVAIVCNLVADAQQLARALRERTNVPIDLFHARFCFAHRQAKELDAVNRFGPKGPRDHGRILVATQVVEQSLDLDFDWLVTQLCPVDLLFQRMGRLHRHGWNRRPAGLEHPRCTVLLPEGHAYGLHGRIYADPRVLWRTAKKVCTAPGGAVVFPDAYRSWIESVYRDECWGDEPAEIEAGHEKFMTEDWARRYLARQMVSSAMNPFQDNDEKITAVTRDSEMNLTLVPFCRSPEGKRLMDGTVLDSLDDFRKPEALMLNSIGVPASWKHALNDRDDEGRYWLPMSPDGESFSAVANGVTYRYHKDTGMEKSK